MHNCLYCQRDNPSSTVECHNCGMPLPTQAEHNQKGRERRFIWFCVALTAFCLVMTIWLPRVLF